MVSCIKCLIFGKIWFDFSESRSKTVYTKLFDIWELYSLYYHLYCWLEINIMIVTLWHLYRHTKKDNSGNPLLNKTYKRFFLEIEIRYFNYCFVSKILRYVNSRSTTDITSLCFKEFLYFVVIESHLNTKEIVLGLFKFSQKVYYKSIITRVQSQRNLGHYSRVESVLPIITPCKGRYKSERSVRYMTRWESNRASVS